MAAFLTTASEYTCEHGGKILFATSNTRTKTGDAAILLQSDAPYTIDALCKNANPSKCTIATFAGAASKSSIIGSAPLTEDSKGTAWAGTVPFTVKRISNSSAASGE